MCSKYYEQVGRTIHTKYIACRSEIKWNIQAIAGDNNADGFIVQRFQRVASPGLSDLPDERYYEAWRVIGGKCIDGGRYDDGYNVVICPSDKDQIIEELVDAIVISAGTTGIIEFCGQVYWISNSDILFSQIKKWKRGTIKNAGTLLSIEKFIPLEGKPPMFEHNFKHYWNFVKEDVIIETAFNVFDKAFPPNVRDANLIMNIKQMNISDLAKQELASKLGVCMY